MYLSLYDKNDHITVNKFSQYPMSILCTIAKI
jgi:hypothetical protein